MAQTELFWDEAHSFAEMMSECALIAKAVIQSPGGIVLRRHHKGFGGLLETDAKSEFIRGNSEGFVDLAEPRYDERDEKNVTVRNVAIYALKKIVSLLRVEFSSTP